MSKIKDYLIHQQEQEYEMYIGYEEWLYENTTQELKQSDINEMEEESNNPSTSRNFIVSNLNQKVVNNPNYFPRYGA